MPKTSSAATPETKPRMRDNWPKGLFGTLAYITDYVLHGFTRPVDWSRLRALEDFGHGFVPLLHNGAVLVLDPQELDVLGLMAKGFGRAEIAGSLQLTERAVSKASRKITEGLGVSTARELHAIAASHGLK